MEYEVWEPAQTFDIMTGIKEVLLISTIKFVGSGYIYTVFDEVKVNIDNASR